MRGSSTWTGGALANDDRRAAKIAWRLPYLCGGQLTSCVPQPGRTADSTHRATRSWPGSSTATIGGPRIAGRGALGGYRGRRRRRALVRVPSRRAPQPTLYQQGTFAPGDSTGGWPARRSTGRNIGIGYSFGGGANFAGQRFAARLARRPEGPADVPREHACRGRSCADDDDAVGGLHPDGDRSDRRLHDLVRGRLPEGGRDVVFHADRRSAGAGVSRALSHRALLNVSKRPASHCGFSSGIQWPLPGARSPVRCSVPGLADR